MNNFDEFLKSKVNEEKEKFTLPKDVDSKQKKPQKVYRIVKSQI